MPKRARSSSDDLVEKRWVLVTGQPGAGKTTLVRRIYEVLRSHGVQCTGFYTDEVCDKSGSRVGFDVVTIPSGERGVLSRKSGLPKSFPTTGKYYVDVASFEKLALPTLRPSAAASSAAPMDKHLVIIDEIGRMELHSERFKRAIGDLLLDGATPVFGAITAPIYGHRVAFCDDVEEHARVQVTRINQKSRDDVREALQTQLIDALGIHS